MYPALQSCIVPNTQSMAYNTEMYQHGYQHQYYQPQVAYQGYPQYNYNEFSNYQSAPMQYNANQQYQLGWQQVNPTTTPPAVCDPGSYDHSAWRTNTTTAPTSLKKRPVKPPYSYAALICMAINSATEKKATLREILTYIEKNYDYYRTNKKWHGTIRHDLTVNDCFVKWDPREGEKACLWSVHPEYQDMFSSSSLRRRRYRFKQGSSSWLKARKQSAARRHRTQCMTITGTPPRQSGCGYQSLTDSPNTSLEDFSSFLTSCDSLNQLLSPQPSPREEPTKLDDILTSIPTFDDCVEDLYNSFQTDYYNTL